MEKKEMTCDLCGEEIKTNNFGGYIDEAGEFCDAEAEQNVLAHARCGIDAGLKLVRWTTGDIAMEDKIRAIFTEHEITERSISSLPHIISELKDLMDEAWFLGAHHAVCNEWDEVDLLNHIEK